MTTATFSRIPAKPVIEVPKLVIRQIGGRQYYWCSQRQRWVKFTRRCPLL